MSDTDRSLLEAALDAFDFELSASGAGPGDSGRAPAEDYQITWAEDGAPVRLGDSAERFEINGRTPLELRGEKRSQRSELQETDASDDANVDGAEVWYAWSIYIDPMTLTPDKVPGEPPARLHLGQFHQRDAEGRSDKPALMFELSPDGDFEVKFEKAIGKRTYTLVEGGPDAGGAKGQWIDVVVGAQWSKIDGVTEIWVRTENDPTYDLMVQDHGQNTSTGNLYFKYGVYRSFLERDSVLEHSRSVAYYDAISRGESFGEVALPVEESEFLIGGVMSDFGFDAEPVLTFPSAPMAPAAEPFEPLPEPVVLSDLGFDLG